MPTIELSDEAAALVCGLVAPSTEVNADGICVSEATWTEVREKFPLYAFRHAVEFNIIPEYHEEF